MGQTLTHGVYLPSEGERNCYNGLASNWRLLDGAIGTVAAHTTAIAGKADISHTHGNISNDGKVGTTANQPLITGTGGAVQAGSFGNQANTFCEGNDSRLSDARTPVAHTHVTADVTDLLNTAHEWTKEQVCDEGFTSKSTTMERCVTPATIQHINFTFKDKNGKGIGAIRRYFRNSGEQQIQIFGNTRIKDGQYDETGSDEFFGFSEVIRPDGTKYFSFDGYLNNSIRPRLTNTYQLGDSSYKWKSFNGINPGALSLPDVRAAVADPIDTVGWNLTGSRNTYTPTENGWFFIRVAGTGNCAINIHNGSSGNEYPTWFNSSTGGYATLVVPVEKSITLYVYITATSIEYCSFRPCIGNV